MNKLAGVSLTTIIIIIVLSLSFILFQPQLFSNKKSDNDQLLTSTPEETDPKSNPTPTLTPELTQNPSPTQIKTEKPTASIISPTVSPTPTSILLPTQAPEITPNPTQLPSEIDMADTQLNWENSYLTVESIKNCYVVYSYWNRTANVGFIIITGQQQIYDEINPSGDIIPIIFHDRHFLTNTYIGSIVNLNNLKEDNWIEQYQLYQTIDNHIPQNYKAHVLTNLTSYQIEQTGETNDLTFKSFQEEIEIGMFHEINPENLGSERYIPYPNVHWVIWAQDSPMNK